MQDICHSNALGPTHTQSVIHTTIFDTFGKDRHVHLKHRRSNATIIQHPQIRQIQSNSYQINYEFM